MRNYGARKTVVVSFVSCFSLCAEIRGGQLLFEVPILVKCWFWLLSKVYSPAYITLFIQTYNEFYVDLNCYIDYIMWINVITCTDLFLSNAWHLEVLQKKFWNFLWRAFFRFRAHALLSWMNLLPDSCLNICITLVLFLANCRLF